MKIKRILSVLIIISIVLSFAIPANADNTLGSGEYKLFDANSDGEIDIVDLVALENYLEGNRVNIKSDAVDSNGDGTVNDNDIPYLQQTILMDEDLPINNDDYWSQENSASASQSSLVSRTAPTEKSVTVLTNNYDDSGLTFTNSFASSYTSVQKDTRSYGRTSATYNGSTITDLTFNNAAVEQTTNSSSAATNAVHFGFSSNGETSSQQENNTVKLYKKTDSGITYFTPEPNTTYSITFDYKVDAINSNDPTKYWGWPTTLKLVYANDANGSSWSYNASNVILDRMVYCEAVVGWTTKTVTFRTGNDVKPLGIILQSVLYTYWANPQDMWLDNIVLKETTQDLEPDFSSKVTSSIMNEDFSSVATGSIPSGWVKNHAYNFLWAADKASTNCEVKNDGTRNYLYYYSINGGHILTLPSVDVRNYKYTVQMRLRRNRGDYRMGGKIGLATDISEEVSTKENSNIFLFDLRAGEAGIFNREYYYADYGGIDNNKRAFGVKRSNNTSFDNTAVETITLTAYHVDGYTYYYYENNYVGCIKGKDSLTDNNIGIYYYGQWNGADAEILSVSVDELLDLTDSYDYTEKVYAQDFSDTAYGQMPSDMTLLEGDSWQWVGNNSTLKKSVENGTNKKVMRFGTSSRDATIYLPSFSSGDYCYNMNLKVDDTDNFGKFGFITNMNGGDGGSLMTLALPVNDSNGGTFTLENRVTWQHLNKQEYAISDYLGKAVNSGDEVLMSVYHIGNKSKFYVNGTFIGEVTDYYSTANNQVGIYSSNGEILINDISIYKIGARNVSKDLKVNTSAIRFADINGNITKGGVRITGTLAKSSSLYTNNISGAYKYSSKSNLQLGLLFIADDVLNGGKLNLCTDGANVSVIDTDISQTDSVVSFRKGYTNMDIINCDKTYSVRAFATVNNQTVYSEVAKVCPSKVANIVYDSESAENQEKISTVYGDSGHFYHSADYNLTFTLFSDFHYKDGCYLARVADLNTIMDRANASNSDFVIHGGDFCNDFRGSPELTNAYLNNAYNLKVYGIYGNHELESANNNMGYVTTKLTNNSDVVWGTQDGKIGDGTIGYYYYKAKGFRIICTDTNYSYNPTSGAWEHNTTNSYGSPSGNTNMNSLGPVQLAWLENVLTDAANNNIPCIVLGHASFYINYEHGHSSDAQAVMNIYNKVNAIKSNTVIMSINGHEHADGPQHVVDNVLYFSTNSTINGFFGTGANSYPSGATYTKDTYDSNGNLLSSVVSPLTDLDKNYLAASNFYNAPLSTTVHINNLKQIVIDTYEAGWFYDVAPTTSNPDIKPQITGGTYNLD